MPHLSPGPDARCGPRSKDRNEGAVKDPRALWMVLAAEDRTACCVTLHDFWRPKSGNIHGHLDGVIARLRGRLVA